MSLPGLYKIRVFNDSGGILAGQIHFCIALSRQDKTKKKCTSTISQDQANATPARNDLWMRNYSRSFKLDKVYIRA